MESSRQGDSGEKITAKTGPALKPKQFQKPAKGEGEESAVSRSNELVEKTGSSRGRERIFVKSHIYSESTSSRRARRERLDVTKSPHSRATSRGEKTSETRRHLYRASPPRTILKTEGKGTGGVRTSFGGSKSASTNLGGDVPSAKEGHFLKTGGGGLKGPKNSISSFSRRKQETWIAL